MKIETYEDIMEISEAGGKEEKIPRNGLTAWVCRDARGKIHRIDGPAVVEEDSGRKEYWRNGKFLFSSIDKPKILQTNINITNAFECAMRVKLNIEDLDFLLCKCDTHKYNLYKLRVRRNNIKSVASKYMRIEDHICRSSESYWNYWLNNPALFELVKGVDLESKLMGLKFTTWRKPGLNAFLKQVGVDTSGD